MCKQKLQENPTSEIIVKFAPAIDSIALEPELGAFGARNR